ncbi:MAG: hypothetical protein HY286_02080 [Planctomycetes bacterium]|nr:hypothetical protein [Planctomycetota bacterium]
MIHISGIVNGVRHRGRDFNAELTAGPTEERRAIITNSLVWPDDEHEAILEKARSLGWEDDRWRDKLSGFDNVQEQKLNINLLRQLVHESSAIERTASEFGSVPTAPTRFVWYRRSILKVLDDRLKGLAPTQQELCIAHQGCVDLQQCTIVANMIAERRPPWAREFTRLLAGRELPAEERNSSAPRDKQFEMYLACMFYAAGISPEWIEPDLQLSLDAHRLCIAAKRVKTYKGLRDRIQEATQQIRKSKITGVVAIDASILINDKMARYGAMPWKLGSVTTDCEVKKLMDELVVDFQRALTKEPLLGVVMYSCTLFKSSEASGFGISEILNTAPFAIPESAEERVFRKFHQCISTGFRLLKI